MSIAHPARRHLAAIASAAILLAPLSHGGLAFAQSSGGSAAGSGGGGGGSGGGNPANPGGPLSGGGTVTTVGSGGGTTSTSTSSSTQSTQFFPGGVAPVPPGGVLGGGNAAFSSSKPITGSERDSFDFKRGGTGETARGSENSSFVLGERAGVRGAGSSNANVHQVRRGDTLWDICDHYFRNPYQWPRIWAFNPQIQNPHWIFPGDQVRLRSGESLGSPTETSSGSQLIDRRRQVPADTIFLRTEGFIDDDTNNWGEISGSSEEKLLLSTLDDVYLRIGSSHDIKVGQELTVYRPLRNVGGGKLIRTLVLV